MKRSEMQRKLFGAVVACLCSTAVFAAGNELYLVQEPGAISDGVTNKYEITSGTIKVEAKYGGSNNSFKSGDGQCCNKVS